MLGDHAALGRLLLQQSGLPGPRANLELAAAFADVVAERGPVEAPWDLLFEWATLGAAEAPTNHPRVYLSVCALQALATLFVDAEAPMRERIAVVLGQAAEDDRWRVREAAAMGLQRVGERDLEPFFALVEAWAEASSQRRQRAALVALAHPPLLGKTETALRALDLTDAVLRRFEQRMRPGMGSRNEADWVDDPGSDDERPARGLRRRSTAGLGPSSEDERVLQKALEFAPSVLVAAAPDAGFAMLRRWASSSSPLVLRIVAANLRKSRLARRFPAEVEVVGEVLAASAE